MRIKRREFVLRANGYFHLKDRKVKALHPGDGYGAAWVFEVGPLDVGFGLDPLLYEKLKGFEFYYFPTDDELKDMKEGLTITDEKTHKLLGRGWNGKRPFWKLQDFM